MSRDVRNVAGAARCAHNLSTTGIRAPEQGEAERSIQLATEPLGERRARSLVRSGACVHSTRFVVDYYRCTPDHRLLFGGGESCSDRPLDDPKAFVRRYMLRVFPQLADAGVDYAWSGRLATTRSRLPIRWGRYGEPSSTPKNHRQPASR